MIKFNGSIYKISNDNIFKALNILFGQSGLKERHRMFGSEITLFSDIIEFHCYSSLENKWQNNEENFIIDCYVDNNKYSAEIFIYTLTNILDGNNITFDFDFYHNDGSGNYIEYKSRVRSTWYDNFMEKHYGIR